MKKAERLVLDIEIAGLGTSILEKEAMSACHVWGVPTEDQSPPIDTILSTFANWSESTPPSYLYETFARLLVLKTQANEVPLQVFNMQATTSVQQGGGASV